MGRVLLAGGLLVTVLAGCPAPPPAPPPYPAPYRTCAEVLAAWEAGLIRDDSVIDGAVWIVDEQGRTVRCPVPPR